MNEGKPKTRRRYKPKPCRRCPREFEPSGPRQLDCDTCRGVDGNGANGDHATEGVTLRQIGARLGAVDGRSIAEALVDLAAPPDAPGPPLVPTSDAKRGPGAPDTLIDTSTLLRLSIRFGQDYDTASTVDLSTRFEAVCETLGAGDHVVDALLDMASLCVCLANQRTR
jgi:hypothetical protein